MSQEITEILEKLNRGESFTFERTFTVDREAMDEESRTVNVAFASGDPIDHWFGKLCLSMTKKAMRSERLKSGAPLLMDHRSWDWQAQVGVIERFEIGDDGVARADVRFSKSARGEEVFQDVKDGIRQQISVGFLVHEMHLESSNKDKKKGDVYRSDDWEPYEISIVSVAADYKKAGVGRSAQFQPVTTGTAQPETRAISNSTTETNMEPEITNPPAAPAVETKPAQRSAALLAADEIREWGEVMNEQDAATAFIRACQTAETPVVPTKEAFFATLRSARPAAPVVPPMPAAEAAARNGAPQQGIQLARTIKRYGRIESFKGENAEERAYRFGQFVLAAVAGVEGSRRFCNENGIALTRAQSEGVNEKGGYLVPEEFGNDMIDLIEKYGVFRQHAKIVPMSSDTRSDPRITGELDAYFTGESTAITESDFETDRVNLVAKKLAAYVVTSSELSEDAAISVGDEIAKLAARAFAKKEDNCGFNGDGSATYGQMTGVREKLKGLSGTIANIAGLKVGSGNAYSELTLADFRGVVALLPEYADQDAKWFCHRSFYWDVMVGALLAAGGVTATEIEDARRQVFLGYPVVFSQVMPKTEANSQVCTVFGDLAMGASLGDRRSYSFTSSEHVRFAQDDTVFKATERFDINVHSVGNASATAADRVPGPIVGLITAAA